MQVMNVLKNLFSWSTLENSLTRVVQRFPLGFVALVTTTTLSVVSIIDQDFIPDSLVVRLIMTSGLVVSLSVLTCHIRESGYLRTVSGMFAQAMIMLFAVVYFFSLPQNLDTVSYEIVMLHAGLQVLLFFAVTFALGLKPFRDGSYDDARYYNYLVDLGLNVLQSGVVAGVLFLSGATILGTVDLLFGVSLGGEKGYLVWLVISAVLVAPLYFLNSLPDHLPSARSFVEKFLKYLVRYVAIPFVVVYSLILFAYSIRVLANFEEWPQSEVSWIVILFSFFSYLVYVLSFNLSGELFVQRIRSMIPIMTVLQSAMLFYAIALRINQHGWTVNRYLVVAFGIWIVGVSLYFVYTRTCGRLIAVPLSLFVIVTVILYTPNNMFAVAERSQLEILERDLVSAGIVTASGIESIGENDNQPDQALSRSIYSRITYLCEYHGCRSLANISPDLLPKASGDIYGYEVVRYLGISPDGLTAQDYEDEYVSYYDSFYLDDVDISDYERMYQFSGGDNLLNPIVTDGSEVRITIEGITLDITDELLKLLETNRVLPGNDRFGKAMPSEAEARPIEIEQENRTYRIIVGSIGGTREGDAVTINTVEGIVLVGSSS